MRDARFQRGEAFAVEWAGFRIDDDVIGAEAFEHVHGRKRVVRENDRAALRLKQVRQHGARGRRAADDQNRMAHGSAERRDLRFETQHQIVDLIEMRVQRAELLRELAHQEV